MRKFLYGVVVVLYSQALIWGLGLFMFLLPDQPYFEWVVGVNALLISTVIFIVVVIGLSKLLYKVFELIDRKFK